MLDALMADPACGLDPPCDIDPRYATRSRSISLVRTREPRLAL
jgi:hypothetical protein